MNEESMLAFVHCNPHGCSPQITAASAFSSLFQDIDSLGFFSACSSWFQRKREPGAACAPSPPAPGGQKALTTGWTAEQAPLPRPPRHVLEPCGFRLYPAVAVHALAAKKARGVPLAQLVNNSKSARVGPGPFKRPPFLRRIRQERGNGCGGKPHFPRGKRFFADFPAESPLPSGKTRSVCPQRGDPSPFAGLSKAAREDGLGPSRALPVLFDCRLKPGATRMPSRPRKPLCAAESCFRMADCRRQRHFPAKTHMAWAAFSSMACWAANARSWKKVTFSASSRAFTA